MLLFDFLLKLLVLLSLYMTLCVVFRQGDVGTNWYAVLSGSLDMNVSETGDTKVHYSPPIPVALRLICIVFTYTSILKMKHFRFVSS